MSDTLVKARACVVCNLRSNVLLCQHCASRPDIVEFVEGLLAGIERQIAVASVPFTEMQLTNYEAWRRIEAARTAPDWAERAANARAAGNIYGQLLDAEATMQQMCAPLQAERARLMTALDAIRRTI